MNISELTKRIVEFRDHRQWKQFHTPKDMLLALGIEVSELSEHFLWKSDPEIETALAERRNEIASELADVLYWVLLLAHDFEIDLASAFEDKMKINESKYPLDKARGKSTKYNNL